MWPRRCSRVLLVRLMAVFGIGLSAQPAEADHFTYIDESGKTVQVEARLAGSGDGLHALELADGHIKLVPQSAITKREIAPGPEPMAPEAIMAQLTEKFGEETFRAFHRDSYIIGLVLAAPLPRQYERRTQGFMRKAIRFMRHVESAFLDFAKDVHLPIQSPRYPLVTLIFETDEDFEKYTTEITRGRGLSAGNIAGFYSPVTNYLVLRLSECHTFEVPLHEAIHQQVYNRQVFQRLAPIPKWFDEGIATGFEGNGERIRGGPFRINSTYARLAQTAHRIDWNEIVSNDRAFRGDVLAGDAYAHAWSLHWLLVREYRTQYSNYVKQLSQKPALSEPSASQRREEFQEVFGKTIEELQEEFQTALGFALKRQRVSLQPRKRPGFLSTQTSLADVEMSAVKDLSAGDFLQVSGRIKNISPIRPMSFYVTVETDSGTYADWHVPNVQFQQIVPLKRQAARKLMRNARGGSSRQFRIRVRAAIPDGETDQHWKRGEFPVPVYEP